MSRRRREPCAPDDADRGELPRSVEEAVRRVFPAEQQPAVRCELRRYSWSNSDRVFLAILALADGDLRQSRRFVTAANTDWRDVLYWAEYASNEEDRAEMARRYRRLGVSVPRDLR